MADAETTPVMTPPAVSGVDRDGESRTLLSFLQFRRDAADHEHPLDRPACDRGDRHAFRTPGDRADSTDKTSQAAAGFTSARTLPSPCGFQQPKVLGPRPSFWPVAL